MRLNNINGTSEKNCACDSWLNHYNNFSGQSVPDSASQNEAVFANAARAGHVPAAGGLGSLYGQNLSDQNVTRGVQPRSAETRGFWDAFGDAHARQLDTARVPGGCAVIGCPNTAEVGAHVQKDSSTDKSWYIVPLCKKHNAETGKTIDVSESTALVSANVTLTCGKK